MGKVKRKFTKQAGFLKARPQKRKSLFLSLQGCMFS
jgi:hypothetical protein